MSYHTNSIRYNYAKCPSVQAVKTQTQFNRFQPSLAGVCQSLPKTFVKLQLNCSWRLSPATMSTARCQASPCSPCGPLPAVGDIGLFSVWQVPQSTSTVLPALWFKVHVVHSIQPPWTFKRRPSASRMQGCRDAGQQPNSGWLGSKLLAFKRAGNSQLSPWRLRVELGLVIFGIYYSSFRYPLLRKWGSGLKDLFQWSFGGF